MTPRLRLLTASLSRYAPPMPRARATTISSAISRKNTGVARRWPCPWRDPSSSTCQSRERSTACDQRAQARVAPRRATSAGSNPRRARQLAATSRGRRPEAGAEAREVCGAQRRGFGDLRAHDRHAQQVGLELHQQVVGRRAAVDAQFDAAAGRASRCIATSTSALWKAMASSAARAMCARVVPRDRPDHGAARVGVPVRAAEAR